MISSFCVDVGWIMPRGACRGWCRLLSPTRGTVWRLLPEHMVDLRKAAWLGTAWSAGSARPCCRVCPLEQRPAPAVVQPDKSNLAGFQARPDGLLVKNLFISSEADGNVSVMPTHLASLFQRILDASFVQGAITGGSVRYFALL